MVNFSGLELRKCAGNAIGLPQSGYENIICAQSTFGIFLGDTPAPRNNRIRNNYIGITPNNTVFGNGTGISLSGADANWIGGDRNSLERNVISGNETDGITVRGNGNTISGNYIGLTVDGMAEAGNITGINLLGGQGNLIGGLNTDPAHPRGNAIGGQEDGYGITQGGGSGNQILGNYLGLNAAGTAAVPNFSGVFISAGGGITLGNGTPEGRNVMAGNLHYGSTMGHNGITPTSGHVIRGNYYGTNAAGTEVIPNGNAALWIEGAHDSRIGGTAPGEGNVINGLLNGIYMINPTAAGNTIVGNWIGILPNGALPAQFLENGIAIGNSANGNSIGLKNSGGQGNLIAHVSNGILVDSAGAIHNGIFGNTVCGFADYAIILRNGGNGGKATPQILFADAGRVSGTAQANDYIEIFTSDRTGAHEGGSLRYLGSGTADESGSWSIAPVGLSAGQYVTALATNTQGSTSTFAANVPATEDIPTPVITATPAVTGTPEATATPAVTGTPEATATPAVTGTPEATATPRIDEIRLDGNSVLISPNPARDRVMFILNLDQPSEVKAVIYNMAGNRVAEVAENCGTGNQYLTWNSRDAAPGIYLVRIFKRGRETAKRKVAIIH